MANRRAEDEREGRMAFDRWRFDERGDVPWDWADMRDVEKQLWIDRARGLAEMPPHQRR
jgi:hypothetical protein